jgi:hypothetical protein
MAKRFMYVCLGVLALVVACHLGSQLAHSQTYGRAMLMAANDARVFILTDEGVIYECHDQSVWSVWASWPGEPPACAGVRAPVAIPTTLGQIKTKFED